MKSIRQVGLALVLAWAMAAVPGRGQTATALDRQVLDLFQQRCADCHGLKQTKYSKPKKPQLDAGTDLAALRNNADYITRGSAANSPLFQRVTLAADNEERMPESSAKEPRPPLTLAEVGILRQWIEPGAPARAFVGDRAVVEAVYRDLTNRPAADRPYLRYLTLHNLSNAGDAAEDLERDRQALSKLVNSLSGQPRIVPPMPIDPAHLIFRLDLRYYGWSADKWELLVKGYPYAIVLNIKLEKQIADLTGSPLSYLRGDWFIFAASQPPLYHQLLDLPATDRALERTLGVEVAGDIRAGKAQRAGFARSGVSQFNRMIERHPLAAGAYWKSYDFKSSDGLQDLFHNPLGPPGLGYRFAFAHNGGEIIWNLPNGLQAYLLVTAKGERLDRAPTEIVNDRSRADSAIINGISCMKCHTEGMKVAPKGGLEDELRPAAQEALDLTAEEKTLLYALYPAPATFKALYEGDGQRFKTALAQTGTKGAEDPVAFLYDRFRQDITARSFASEFGLEAGDLQAKLAESADEQLRVIGARLKAAGAFPRKSFIEQFRLTIEGLQLGRLRSFELVHHEDFFPGEAGGTVGAGAQSATPPPTTQVSPPADGKLVNSLGMTFVPVSGTAVRFSIWDTRVQDYQAFATATGRAWEKPSFKQGPTHPAVMVSWEDAQAFCGWLTTRERAAGRLEAGQEYRLPTDAEWSVAVGLGVEPGRTPEEKDGKIEDQYPWGTGFPPPKGAGNYDPSLKVDDFEYTSPVGSFVANRFGLYDMGGNVWQWCEDEYYAPSESGAYKGARVLRGASWVTVNEGDLRSSCRLFDQPSVRYLVVGFRVVVGAASAR